MLLHHSPYLPTCKTKANERAFAAEEPRHTPGIIPFSVCPIIRCPQTGCMEQLPLSSKQALRDSSGSLKERTEEPLGSLNKVTYHDLTLTLRSQIPQAAPCRTTA